VQRDPGTVSMRAPEIQAKPKLPSSVRAAQGTCRDENRRRAIHGARLMLRLRVSGSLRIVSALEPLHARPEGRHVPPYLPIPRQFAHLRHSTEAQA
jgi:hypothetical protein